MKSKERTFKVIFSRAYEISEEQILNNLTEEDFEGYEDDRDLILCNEAKRIAIDYFSDEMPLYPQGNYGIKIEKIKNQLTKQ